MSTRPSRVFKDSGRSYPEVLYTTGTGSFFTSSACRTWGRKWVGVTRLMLWAPWPIREKNSPLSPWGEKALPWFSPALIS